MKSSSSPFIESEDAITHRLFILHRTNRHPWTSAFSSSTGSHKRPSYENPPSHLLNSKKPKNNADNGNFLSGFAKIPVSAPSLETQSSLGGFQSDLYRPPIGPLVEEPPHSPTPKSKIEFPGTPAKLPPPRGFPAKTFSSSCGFPNPEWLRKMGNCMREMSREWDQVLGYVEHTENAEMSRTTDNNDGDNNSNCLSDNRNIEAIMENSREPSIESVNMEKKGEDDVSHICCAESQLLLVGGNCYYKLV